MTSHAILLLPPGPHQPSPAVSLAGGFAPASASRPAEPTPQHDPRRDTITPSAVYRMPVAGTPFSDLKVGCAGGSLLDLLQFSLRVMLDHKMY